jgi:four helix bundle protein
MDKRENFDKLKIYCETCNFSDKIWEICINWDYFAKKTIGLQLIRSADSISANIAEGYGRYYYKKNLKFCYYARGSFSEAKDWINKAKNRKLLTTNEDSELSHFIENFLEIV